MAVHWSIMTESSGDVNLASSQMHDFENPSTGQPDRNHFWSGEMADPGQDPLRSPGRRPLVDDPRPYTDQNQATADGKAKAN